MRVNKSELELELLLWVVGVYWSILRLGKWEISLPLLMSDNSDPTKKCVLSGKFGYFAFTLSN